MLEHIFHHFYHLLEEILPVFFLAIIASSLIDKFLPDSYIEKVTKEKSGFFTIMNASVIGSLIPICTCGMIPLAIKLHKKGLNWKVLVAFLVAGNACSIPALVLTTTLGHEITLIRFISSVLFGVLVTYGLAVLAGKDFSLKLETKSCCDSEHKQSIFKRIYQDLKEMVLGFMPWILLAVLIASVIDAYVNSSESFAAILSSGPSSYISPVLASVIGFPFYFCAGADIPLSQEFIQLGLTLGTVISFMLASPGINLTSLLVYQKAVGLKQAWVFVLVSVFVSSMIGIVLNQWQW